MNMKTIQYGEIVDVLWHNGKNCWQIKAENPKRYETATELDILNPIFFLKKAGSNRFHGRVQGTYAAFSNKQGRKFYFKVADGTFRYVDNDERIHQQDLPERLSFSLDDSQYVARAVI